MMLGFLFLKDNCSFPAGFKVNLSLPELDCHWVGSLGVPRNSPKVVNVLHGGQQQQREPCDFFRRETNGTTWGSAPTAPQALNHSFLVLEAQGRVGGRTLNQDVAWQFCFPRLVLEDSRCPFSPLFWGEGLKARPLQ